MKSCCMIYSTSLCSRLKPEYNILLHKYKKILNISFMMSIYAKEFPFIGTSKYVLKQKSMIICSMTFNLQDRFSYIFNIGFTFHRRNIQSCAPKCQHHYTFPIIFLHFSKSEFADAKSVDPVPENLASYWLVSSSLSSTIALI